MSPIKVAFYTKYPHLCEGGLFEAHRIPGSYPSRPFYRLKQDLESDGWIVLTYDQVHQKSSLDVIIFLDLPGSPREVRSVRSACPKATVVLYVLESPPHHPGQFSARNYDCFDYVITYNLSGQDGNKVFFCPIPFDELSDGGLSRITPWQNRRILTVVNGRKKAGFLVSSGSGYLYRFGVRGLGEPWHTPFLRFLTQWSGYQYDLRNKLVEALDACPSSSSHFDVYGSGWNGEPIGYWERFVGAPPSIKSSKGAFDGDKLSLLSEYRYTLIVENWRGDEGYVSEKLFEALSAGCVPVYWGDPGILKTIPKFACINGHRFPSASSLFQFLLSESEMRWNERLVAIDRFRSSCCYQMRTPRGFAQRFTEILRAILNKENS